MSLKRSQFRLFDRGYEETIALVPGWGTDYRIFSRLDLRANYLVPVSMALDGFADDLSQALDELSFSQISLVGSSLGGFMAARFANLYPDRVSGLTLVGIRRRYDPASLEEVAERLRRNKKAFLYKFYRSCFSLRDAQGLQWFKDNLFSDYVKTMTEESLLEGIEYLASAALDTLPRDFTATIFHGTEDAVAPFPEALEIARNNGARFIPLDGLGHIPFFNSAFHTMFCGCDYV
jgi:pimeloyl-ACP methyl ester carboxylesterase